MGRKKKLRGIRNLFPQNAAIADVLSSCGPGKGPIIDESKKQAMKKVLDEKAYHNTEMLLESYRDIAWMLECYPDQLEEELETPMKNVDQLLDRVDAELSMENRKLESRLLSVRKTRLMFDRLNEAISLLKRYNDNGKEMYNLIYRTYIGERYDSIYNLFDDLNMSKRKYYDMKKRAVNLISQRLWFSENSEVDIWLEIVMLLEGNAE